MDCSNLTMAGLQEGFLTVSHSDSPIAAGGRLVSGKPIDWFSILDVSHVVPGWGGGGLDPAT